MTTLALGRGSLLVIGMFFLTLCGLSFVLGLAVELPDARPHPNGDAATAAMPPPPAAGTEAAGPAGRAREAAGAAFGTTAARLLGRPVERLSQAAQQQTGRVPDLGHGIAPAEFLGTEVDRQARTADRPIAALGDHVRAGVAGPSAGAEPAAPGPAGSAAAAGSGPAAPPDIVTIHAAPSAPAGTAAMAFTLELATLHSRPGAQDFARAVMAHGYAVEIIEETTPDGGTLFRIHQGRFADRALAARAAQALQQRTGMGASIVAAPARVVAPAAPASAEAAGR